MRRPRAFALSAILPLSIVASAQAPAPKAAGAEALQALDREVWLPFAKAFAEGDSEAYLALHSKAFVRAMGDPRRIDTYDQWAAGTRGMFKALAERGGKLRIRFRFLERIANAESASERGIYETTHLDAKGGTRKSYGKFHVISRREDGRWKILVDYDSSEGRSIDEAAFQAAHAPEDYGRY